MDTQAQVTLEWEAPANEAESKALRAAFGPDESGVTIEVQTESNLGGLEAIFQAIAIGIATGAGKKIAEVTWGVFSKLKNAKPESLPKTITVTASWDGANVSIKVPTDDEEKAKKILEALETLKSLQ